MQKFKYILEKLFNLDIDKFDFLEQTEEGNYVFYCSPYEKGIEVKSLKELQPILMYFRLSATFNVFLIMTLFIILVIFLHQLIDLSRFFTVIILTLCITSCAISGLFKWHLNKLKKIPVKQKISKSTKIITAMFVLAYILMCLSVFYICPCLVFGQFMDNNEWQKASDIISFYIKLQPKNEYLYESRAVTKYNLNNINGAIQDIDKSLELKPNNKCSLSMKTYYSFMQTKKITPDILENLNKIENLNKDDVELCSVKGKIYFLLNENDEAVKYFENAYLKSGNEYYNYLSALAYEHKGDYCKAFAYYNTVPQNKYFKISELTIKKEYAKFMCKD